MEAEIILIEIIAIDEEQEELLALALEICDGLRVGCGKVHFAPLKVICTETFQAFIQRCRGIRGFPNAELGFISTVDEALA